VQFLVDERTIGTVLVTSPTAGDGKTTTLANLAVALARSGLQIVVVSCDLRRPRVHEFFDTPNDVGFTSVILGTTPLSAALWELPSDPRIRILPSGPLPMNPAELLSSQRTRDVLASIASLCDIVLIDCPPVLPVTDSTVLSSRVDGTLLVAFAGTTTRKQLSRTVQSLRQVDASILGVVLNGVTSEEGYGYEYDYRPGKRKAHRSRRAPKNGSSAKNERAETAPKGVTPI
jgi:capsular exopolysaccharide synthesis family protein